MSESLPEFDGATERINEMIQNLQKRLGPPLQAGSVVEPEQILDFTITMSRVSVEMMHKIAMEALIDGTVWGEEVTSELMAQHLTVYANYIEALAGVLESATAK